MWSKTVTHYWPMAGICLVLAGSGDLLLLGLWFVVQHKLVLLVGISASVMDSSNPWVFVVQGVVRVSLQWLGLGFQFCSQWDLCPLIALVSFLGFLLI